jgi:hypothetical protein
MAPWTFSIKFPFSTQFTFGSLIFATGEDGNLKFLTRGPAPKQLAPVYGQAPYLSANSSTSGGPAQGNPYAGPYHPTAKIAQGLPIGAHIFQPSARTSSSFTLGASPDHDSTDDYPEIWRSTCWNSAQEGQLIIMVAPTGAPSQNNSS